LEVGAWDGAKVGGGGMEQHRVEAVRPTMHEPVFTS
jgi:hypothetical protein